MAFINKIGGWRVSKSVNIKLPNELYQVVENQIVEIPTSKDGDIQNDEHNTDSDDIVSKIEKVNNVTND